jgi:hypothetical protein
MPDPKPEECHVYSNGTDWVWGASLTEALTAYAAEFGGPIEDFFPDEFEQVDDDCPITVLDVDSNFDWPDGKKTLTAREWIVAFISEPRSDGSVCRLICSTEY